jgi:hypothetical protein
MRLSEWIKAGPVIGTYYRGEIGDPSVYVVPDVLRPDRAEAWHLEDYRVTSVCGGSIWLRTREPMTQNGTPESSIPPSVGGDSGSASVAG